MKTWKRVRNWMDRKLIGWRNFAARENAGMGTVEVILIIVVIFTIYMGCK
ncbi:MAG: hypothetical protein J6B43_03285 [Lachnospiraceae bacterium]|nr:hypothetical protein [Lachnospiraceae bacterium]